MATALLSLPTISLASVVCSIGLGTDLCSVFEIAVGLDPTAIRSQLSDHVGTAIAGQQFEGQLTDVNQNGSAIAEATVRTDFGVNSALVSAFSTSSLAFNQAIAFSAWQDVLEVEGVAGQQFTIQGHVHAIYSGTQALTTSPFQVFEYAFQSFFGNGISVNNFAFGDSDIFSRNQNSPVLLVAEELVPFSVTYTLLQTNGSILLQSFLSASAHDNRRVDALGTASIDAIFAPTDMLLSTGSGALQGGNGIFRFAGVEGGEVQVPEPQSVALVLMGLGCLLLRRRQTARGAPRPTRRSYTEARLVYLRS